MALRVQLLNEFLGPLTIEEADPIGINEVTQTVKRSTDNEGVIYEVIFDIDFIKQGRNYLKEAFEKHGGIDAEVLVNMYEYDPNLRKWKLYANGKINYNKYDLYEDKVTVNIEQIGFQRRILNLLDTNIDIETTVSQNGSAIPPINSFQVPYHSKTIYKKSSGGPQDSNESPHQEVFPFNIPPDDDPPPPNPITNPIEYEAWLALGHPFSVEKDAIMVGSMDTNKATFEELTDFFKVGFSYPQLEPGMGAGSKTTAEYITHLTAHKEERFEIYRATEAGKLRAAIDINMRHAIEVLGSGGDTNYEGAYVCGIEHNKTANTEIIYWFEMRDKNDNILILEPITRAPTMPCGTTDFPYVQASYTKEDVNIEVGYKIYVYHTIRVWGTFTMPIGFSTEILTHNFFVQASPREWDDKSKFDEGERVIYSGKVWASLVGENIGHAPVAGEHWEFESDWVGVTTPTQIFFENATVAPSTIVKTFLLHDVYLQCCRYLTNEIDCFASDLLGRTELGYAVDGEGAFIGWTNGGNLRAMEDKKVFTSIKELIDFTDAVFCVGFGFEIDSGRNLLRLEKRNFFYNKNTPILSLGKVYDIKKRLNQKMFYNEIEYGYQGKLDIGKVNAVDEFNTLRKAAIPIINTKNKYKISVKTRTSGYQIEHQRRLQFSTTDSKLDDENFAIVLIRDSSIGSGFRTKQDEGYESIINVLDPHTGYNYDIAPARCLKNWYPFIGSMLIRSTNKKVKFSYGEVNYVMASKKIGETDYLHEDGEFDLSGIEPLFEPFMYEFKKELRRDSFQLIKTIPYGVIDFEDRQGNKFEAFISDKGVEHDSFKNMGDFELLHVYRK
jgi:hypothetical protein